MKACIRIVRVLLVVLVVAGALLLGGCRAEKSTETGAAGGQDQIATDSEQTESGETAVPESEGETLYTPEYKPNGNETATLETSKGTIVVELFGGDAPIHVGNFVELAQKGFYDNSKFHRYEPGFVVQGGDPQTRDLDTAAVEQAVQTGNPPLGTGGPGYVIKGEFDPSINPQKHVVGALGMARTNAPDSAGSQFYFALQPLTMLDGQYTVFGVVTQGLDVMQELRVGDTIESVKISGAN